MKWWLLLIPIGALVGVVGWLVTAPREAGRVALAITSLSMIWVGVGMALRER